ncbi:regulatory protein RecX [Anaeromicropila herbilytica]|uniref:Regulatory protein RecX n=1 Tax=Anaeromicropila herbilytica TaxID=2785025 RepID=A0A7R7EMM2_9FIRM|nr:RecX family transcriptional regulator [Anaeromicropila herbilytica]BCN31411.1 hypothetical protein bsdtb5_27060 [Anaeromicropila herbilytica]
MIITKLEAIDKKKYKVYIEYEYSFLLYSTDIRKYKLEEGLDMTQELYEEIITDTVLRRGKQKALAILKFMDRTENELRQKLKQGDYAEKLIDVIIEYIKSYHYIDDERYAYNYVRSKKDAKSKRQIQMELHNKGIEKSIIEAALEDELENDDSAIKRAIAKKTNDIESLTQIEKQKLAASLYRKGFRSEDIRKYLS